LTAAIDWLLRTLARVVLLILDNWGLSPLTADQSLDLPVILERTRAARPWCVGSRLRFSFASLPMRCR
jgi:hypothetical protein